MAKFDYKKKIAQAGMRKYIAKSKYGIVSTGLEPIFQERYHRTPLRGVQVETIILDDNWINNDEVSLETA